jgi:eukaryotic-like serine/threonine-protein kinase
VRDVAIAKLGPDHPLTLTTLQNLAANYTLAGKVREAIALLERTRDAETAKLGPDHPLTLTTLYNLAETYRTDGRFREAIELHERVRAARIAKLGPDHPDTVHTLHGLAVTYWFAKQLDRSVPLFEDVLKRMEARLGRTHATTQLVVANLGVNYKDAGRLGEAIPLLEEAYRSRLPSLRSVGEALFDAYVTAGRRTEAAKMVTELLADARKTLPKESPQLADVLAALGFGLIQVKAYADAEPLLRECLPIREKAQPELWKTFNAKSLLGGAVLGQTEYAKAEPLLLAGYDGMKRREATIPPHLKLRLTEALERLVQLYDATNKPDEASRWRKELNATKAAGKPSEKKP